MGVVLKGFDESLERHVAIKVLSRQLATSATARRRFTRECRAVAAVNHPNVITIHAVEEQDGLPFLVMELVEGGSLHERIKKDAPLPLEVVLRFGSQIANGLAAAHAQGVIHRDIKPGNVMLEHQVARVKITDFGLARITMDNSDLTSQGNQLGTPAYMSPEQVHGRNVDDRTDLFSLGCVMYAMIAGHSPFRGTHAFDAARKILELTPPPLNEINDDVPPFIAEIVSKLLEKDPKKRYQTAEEVGEVLNHYLARLNQTRTDELHTLKDETLNFKSSARPNRRFATVIILLLAVIAIGATSPLWFASPKQEQDSQGNSDEEDKPSPPVVPHDSNIITVSKSGAAQFKTIGDALANAAPGTTVRVLDDESYEESLVIDNAGKWHGVQIVADANASLSGPRGTERVIAIMDTPNVVIKGFTIRPRSQQFAIKITGNCEGVTIDEVNIETPDENWAAVYITRQARGSKLHPIEVRNSRFDVNNIGVDVEGKAETGDCITDVAIKNNRFSGTGNHVLLVQSVRNVEISGNTFAGGKGIVCALAHPDASESIQITNNTFFENDEWLFLGHARPDIKDVSVRNNLIVGSARIGTQSASLSDFATSWDFSHNLWEPGADTDRSQIPTVAELIEDVRLISRDPQHAEFLHPSSNTRLAGRGAGGELPNYIGAFERSNSD
jgi:serine/threonine protein kinase